jgi:hypothetical protein
MIIHLTATPLNPCSIAGVGVGGDCILFLFYFQCFMHQLSAKVSPNYGLLVKLKVAYKTGKFMFTKIYPDPQIWIKQAQVHLLGLKIGTTFNINLIM